MIASIVGMNASTWGSRSSRTGQISAVFERNFGAGAKPSKLIEALWILDAVPE